MTTRDLLGFGLSYFYAAALIGLAESIRRWRGYPQDFTRKLVHIGAGMWVFGVLAIFEHWYIGIIPFASFIVLNYLFYRSRLLKAIDSLESSPGTIYFAFSVALLFLLFWRTDSSQDQASLAVAGVMAMTWGDSLAALIGRKWGRHHYAVGGKTRSLEGSAVMWLASGLTIFLTLWLVPNSPLSSQSPAFSLGTCLSGALVGSVVATLAEAFAPAGTDNLSVPLLVSFALFGLTSFLR